MVPRGTFDVYAESLNVQLILDRIAIKDFSVLGLLARKVVSINYDVDRALKSISALERLEEFKLGKVVFLSLVKLIMEMN